MEQSTGQNVIRITHLRDCLGIAYQHVVQSDEPIIVQRYNRQDVALVPLWEWEFLKRVEAAIRAGKRPWEKEPEDDTECYADESDVSRP